ncbi:MAG: hypothetical protein OK455_07980 [Thaumarchaeota archaeon]|nr:hypothetical protein [Nitrososphaerota archaeon]
MTPDGLATLATSILEQYVVPYVVTLVIALIAVSFAMSASKRRAESSVRYLLRAEMKTNTEISRTIVTYAQQQQTSEATVQPMPRYHETAYLEYRRVGLLDRLLLRGSEELIDLYLYMESVNEAGRRQEDLGFGPSAAYPNSHELRLQNLMYIENTVHNVVSPYQERLRRMKI